MREELQGKITKLISEIAYIETTSIHKTYEEQASDRLMVVKLRTVLRETQKKLDTLDKAIDKAMVAEFKRHHPYTYKYSLEKITKKYGHK